jgi:hypothetical protein
MTRQFARAILNVLFGKAQPWIGDLEKYYLWQLNIRQVPGPRSAQISGRHVGGSSRITISIVVQLALPIITNPDEHYH